MRSAGPERGPCRSGHSVRSDTTQTAVITATCGPWPDSDGPGAKASPPARSAAGGSSQARGGSASAATYARQPRHSW